MISLYLAVRQAGGISMLSHNVRYSLFIISLILLISGCSSGSQGDPVSAETFPSADALQYLNSGSTGNHSLLAYSVITINTNTLEYEITPLREIATHWNILSWLEQGPCSDCLKIKSMSQSPDGNLLVGIEISHPFPNPNLTGFDVRGIVLFEGSRYFSSGVTMPDPARGDGGLVNADGFTTLYNKMTAGYGPDGLQGYIQGRLAFNDWQADATLNGYIHHISDDPSNTRNAFYAGDKITNTYEIAVPDEFYFSFGYAVDACWAPPVNKPVDDPMEDFGLDANCPEPWKIDVSIDPIGDGITHEGGSANVMIDVYNWRGMETYKGPEVECPECSYGILTTTMVEDFGDFVRYETVLVKESSFMGGPAKVLVSVEDKGNDPVEWWLDLTAYQVTDLMISGPPVAEADSNTIMQSQGNPVHFFDDGSYDVDGGDLTNWEWDWENDGIYDESGAAVDHAWNIPGTYYVQYRVTDDEGLTGELNWPLEILITESGIPASPWDVTPPDLNNFTYAVAVKGDYSYVASGPNGLQIFNTSSPSNPYWVHNVPFEFTPATDVVISGNYAYVAIDCPGIGVVDISSPESAFFVSTIDDVGLCADLAISGNRLYAVMENIGLYIIDISSPGAPSLIHHMHHPDLAWNAVDVDADDANGYAYIATYGDGIKVVDIDPPGAANIVTTIGDMWAIYHGVDVVGDILYACEANLGLQIYDVSTPESPVRIKTVDTDGFEEAVVVKGELAYVVNSLWESINIVDIDPPETAYEVNSLELPEWPINLFVDNSYAYVAGGSAGLLIVNVSSPESMFLAGYSDSPASALDVVYKDGYAYLPHYNGFKVVDVDPPESATQIATLGTESRFYCAALDGNFVYTTASPGGLMIFDISTPGSPTLAGSCDAPGGMRERLYVSDGLAFLAVTMSDYPVKEGALHIFDVSPPGSASFIKTIEMPGAAMDVVAADGYAYVSVAENGFSEKAGSVQVVDINPPQSAYIAHDHVFVGAEYDGIYTVDISQPLSASVVGFYDISNHKHRFHIQGNYMYVASRYLKIWDISDPLNISPFSYAYTPGDAFALFIEDEYAYIADAAAGLRIYQLW